MRTSTSPCGRFIVLDGLHLDRKVFVQLEQWATRRGHRVQDAIQLALCAFQAGLPSSGRVVACYSGLEGRD